jgi:hypothetical protein
MPKTKKLASEETHDDKLFVVPYWCTTAAWDLTLREKENVREFVSFFWLNIKKARSLTFFERGWIAKRRVTFTLKKVIN